MNFTWKKLCFLFLVYDRLNKSEIWNKFFLYADTSKYSIYAHSKYDIIDNNDLLKKYIIEQKYETEWGTWSIVEVQNRLLEIGLKDSLNMKFIFISDSHVPLHDFDTVYNSIMNNDFSFIDIVGRLAQNNLNTINNVFNVGQNLFKMSQWTCLNRKHAEQLLEHENEMKLQSQFSIIPDENAYICILTGLYFPKKIENLYNKNLTFVDWVIPSSNTMYKAFPRTYDNNELNKLIPTLRNDFLFVRKVSTTCNIDQSIIQQYSFTISAYPQFSSIKKSQSAKTIISVYCKKTKNSSTDLRNYWGLGDMIRGTISIYKLSQELGTQFHLDALDHPISQYLKKQQVPYGYTDFIEKSKNNIYTFYKYFELNDFVKRNLISSNFVAVHSNAVYKDRNSMIEDENNIFLSESDKALLLNYFQPTEEMKYLIDNYIKMFPEKYNIIHFRIGDDFFDGNINQTKLDQLENIFIKYHEQNDVLITDNGFFKNYLKDKYNCFILDTQIVHVGVSEDMSAVKETLLEWYIQSNSSKIKTYSCYGWISGFVYWTHQLFSIPLINMKK
mgnify:CR=1 FL=1